MKNFHIHRPTELEVLMFCAFMGGLMAGTVATLYIMAILGWL